MFHRVNIANVTRVIEITSVITSMDKGHIVDGHERERRPCRRISADRHRVNIAAPPCVIH
jgi:hypothetical protein